MIPALEAAIEAGRARQADIVKVYVYKEDPDLFFLLDFEDDDTFLHPLLLAYYQYRLDCLEQRRSPLNPPLRVRQLLWGYVPAAQRTVPIRVVTDAAGRLYLPNYGTAHTSAPICELDLCWEMSREVFTLWQGEEPVPTTWEPITRIADTAIEVWQHNHVLLAELFRPSEMAPELAAGVACSVKVSAITALKTPDLRRAFALLQQHLPDYFEQVRAAGRSVLLFENPLIRPFAALSTLGATYLSTAATDSILFYLTEIVHQFGHAILGWVMVEPTQYFRIPPTDLLRTHGGHSWDKRTVLSAFHGLYTTTLVAICLEELWRQEIFTGSLRHELLGRLADNQRRFRTGLENLPQATALTAAGQLLYAELDEACAQVYARQHALLSTFDVSNQDFVFSYSKFLQDNPLLPELTKA